MIRIANSVRVLSTALVLVIAGCGSSSSDTGGVATGGAGAIAAGTGGSSSTGTETSTGGTSNANATLVTASECTGAFTACGGDPTGTWQYTALCMEGDMTQSYNDYEEQQYGSACRNAYQSVATSLSGTVTFGAGTVTYENTTVIAGDRIFTSACLSAMTGSTITLTAGMCSNMESTLSQVEGNTATCAFDGSDCNCVITVTTPSAGSDTYTLSGTSLVWSDGTSEELCVQGNSLFRRSQSDVDYVTTAEKQ